MHTQGNLLTRLLKQFKDYVKDLEDKLKAAEEQADSNENDADLFRTLRDELKDNIAKAETAYNDS